jgi:hypothetical protein
MFPDRLNDPCATGKERLPRGERAIIRVTDRYSDQTVLLGAEEPWDHLFGLLIPAEVEDGHLVSGGKQRFSHVFKTERRNGGLDPVRIDECHSHGFMIREIGRLGSAPFAADQMVP